MDRIVMRGARNSSGRWDLEQDGALVAVLDSQDAALRESNFRARARPQHSNGQLVIFREDGSFESEYTFDELPRGMRPEILRH